MVMTGIYKMMDFSEIELSIIWMDINAVYIHEEKSINAYIPSVIRGWSSQQQTSRERARASPTTKNEPTLYNQMWNKHGHNS